MIPKGWATGFRKGSCSNKTLQRDGDAKKSHPALATGEIRHAHDHQHRRHQALLRGSRHRHAGGFRPRIRRRLPDLGAADARLLALASLRHLLGARLSALRGAERSGPLRPGHRARRRGGDHGCARHRQGARGRPFHGRLHRVAYRHPPCRTLYLSDSGRLRLGLGRGPSGARGDAQNRRRERQALHRQ